MMSLKCTCVRVLAVVVAAITLHSSSVAGHGRLVEPPSRSSMWRFGFPTPKNYNDNELFCGGAGRQWQTNNGKCGVCGDPWDGERKNEAGGKFATGIIARSYGQGQTIKVNIDLTANHKGYFEFRLCPNNNVAKKVTQSCLDKHLLTLADGGHRFNVTSPELGIYSMKVVLPADVTCSQCVIQWKYNTGNSWNCEKNGHCCLGCGPQEQFYGCADISISGDETESESTVSSTTDSTGPTTAKDDTGSDSDETGEGDTGSDSDETGEGDTGSESDETGEGDSQCRGAGAWAGRPRVAVWCTINCRLGFCPQHLCTEACRILEVFDF